MGGFIERLRSLLGRGDEEAGAIATDPDAEAVDRQQAIERVEANRDAAQAAALYAMTDTPGSVDGD